MALVSLKSAAAIIPCTVARYRISFAISRMAFVLPPACGPDKTIFTPVILHLEREKSRKKKRISAPCAVRHISQIQCTALHPVAFFRCRVLAIHFGLVPSGPRWNGKTAVRNRTFYVLFPLCLPHKFLFPLSSALAEPLLEIRAVPPGQKNSLETVQAQVEDAHRDRTIRDDSFRQFLLLLPTRRFFPKIIY